MRASSRRLAGAGREGNGEGGESRPREHENQDGPTPGAGQVAASRRVCVLLESGHTGHVRKASLAEAKAHLSELVDEAEHRGKRIMILRHGKPAAAIVPVAVVTRKRRTKRALSEEEVLRSVAAFVAEFSAADPSSSAVEDLIASRR